VTWVVIDYGNDYYIITNRRIIWVEKIIGLYDSRQESPISQMQSASVETGLVGRILDYGDVVTRTFTSRVTFGNIEHPHQVKAMLDEYLNRSKAVSRREEVEAMKQAIRIKLKLAEPQNPPAPPAAAPPGKRINLPRLLVRELFKLRTEESGKIVYRKHWFILLRQVGAVSLMLFLDLAGLLYFGILSRIDNRGTIVAVLFTAFFPLAIWWVYQFADWRNDRFELTSEQIMDIDKKPLGTEQRKTAKLEDILSIEFERIGLLGYLLNFGTVYIKVGTTDFTFNDVHDPASVQAEIEEWRNRRLINKRKAETASERERMAEWIAAYHNNRGEFIPPEN
ncbi:MAG: PH domain-containing protein, partial [Chloroflexota bacterium]